jgi:hypothetical protein
MYASELGQDEVIDKLLKRKTSGTFVDIGACYYQKFNNSFFFETDRGFRGLAVEMNKNYTDGWREHRPNTILVVDDATKVDYQKILDENNFPKVIDFLSVDIDPNTATFKALCKVMNTSYRFNTIAFETDYGRGPPKPGNVRDLSRDFLTPLGYILVKEIYTHGDFHVDDIWVHESIFDKDLKV